MPACGFDDLTEGMYEGDPHRSYEAAQARRPRCFLTGPPAGRAPGCSTSGAARPDPQGGRRPGHVRDGITVCPEQVRRGGATGST